MFDSDFLEKISKLKDNSAEIKTKLENIEVEGEAGGNLVMVRLNGNGDFKKLSIQTDHTLMELEDLEDLISIALKRALEKSKNLQEKEQMNAMQGILPGF